MELETKCEGKACKGVRCCLVCLYLPCLCLPVAAVYNGVGPFEQMGNAARPNNFSQQYCNSAPPVMLMRGEEVWDGSIVCFVNGTSHILLVWGCFCLADAEKFCLCGQEQITGPFVSTTERGHVKAIPPHLFIPPSDAEKEEVGAWNRQLEHRAAVVA